MGDKLTRIRWLPRILSIGANILGVLAFLPMFFMAAIAGTTGMVLGPALLLGLVVAGVCGFFLSFDYRSEGRCWASLLVQLGPFALYMVAFVVVAWAQP